MYIYIYICLFATIPHSSSMDSFSMNRSMMPFAQHARDAFSALALRGNPREPHKQDFRPKLPTLFCMEGFQLGIPETVTFAG